MDSTEISLTRLENVLHFNLTVPERRLGQFKLAGLVATELLDENFDPLPSYEAAAPRSDDTLILTI